MKIYDKGAAFINIVLTPFISINILKQEQVLRNMLQRPLFFISWSYLVELFQGC